MFPSSMQCESQIFNLNMFYPHYLIFFQPSYSAGVKIIRYPCYDGCTPVIFCLATRIPIPSQITMAEHYFYLKLCVAKHFFHLLQNNLNFIFKINTSSLKERIIELCNLYFGSNYTNLLFRSAKIYETHMLRHLCGTLHLYGPTSSAYFNGRMHNSISIR